MKFSAVLFLIGTLSIGANAQRPRTIEQPPKDDPAKAVPTTPAAPTTFKAKYEGGVVGYRTKQDGTLTFDDANQRLLFRNKQNKEVLFIPYDAVMIAYADKKSLQPKAASVARAIPAPYGLNALSMFVKKKYRYLTLNYDDPETRVSGLTSFKVDSKQLLESVLNTLASKAGLSLRGEEYVRKRATANAEPGP
jgi:hypothetical protein